MKSKLICVLVLVASCSSSLVAQLSIDSGGADYSINFNGYNGSAFSPGSSGINSNSWAASGLFLGDIDFGGTGGAGSFGGTASGAVSGAGIYAFDVGGGNGNALGVQPNLSNFFFFQINTFLPGSLTLRLQNNTGTDITSLDIGYDVFSYNDTAFTNSFNFSHSANDSAYTLVSSLNYASGAAAAGSPDWESAARATELSGLSIADGAFYYLRWSISDNSSLGAGERDQFALDNINVSAEVIPEPSTYALIVGGLTLGLVCWRKRRFGNRTQSC